MKIYKLVFQVVTFFFFGLSLGFSQIRLLVTDVPKYTPSDESLYVVGSFNGWNPQDPVFRMKKNQDGQYQITLPDTLVAFEYKYTRGSWSSVESTLDGKQTANRVFIGNDKFKIDTLIQSRVLNWEDLAALTTFRIAVFPESTPHDVSIYISGSFNDWRAADAHYKLTRDQDGFFSITMPPGVNSFEYKFTRGTWASVEGTSNGKIIANRIYLRQTKAPETVDVVIEGWEDLNIQRIEIRDLFLLLASCQGFLLLLLIGLRKTNVHTQANRTLALMVITIVTALIIKVVANEREVIRWFPRLSVITELIYFVYAPLLFMYLQRLLFKKYDYPLNPKKILVPFILQAALYAVVIVLEYARLSENVWFDVLAATVTTLAIMYNLYYWIKCKNAIKIFKPSHDEVEIGTDKIRFIRSLLYINALSLGIWMINYLVVFVNSFLNYDLTVILQMLSDIGWIVFSLNTFAVAYFLFSQPEILRLPKPKEDKKENVVLQAEIAQFKDKVRHLVVDEKVFTNPDLSLADLSEMVGTNTHTLSRVLNDGYEQNFHDFINHYRVKEFIKMINLGLHKNETFLSIAFRVGFNSKTTFNRAFKKVTGSTPRDYFKNVLHSESDL